MKISLPTLVLLLTSIGSPARSPLPQHKLLDSGTHAPFDGVERPIGTEGLGAAYLPVLYPSSHAANLYVLRNGDLLCVWFSGTWEGNSDVGIVISRLREGSGRWSPTRLIDRRAGVSFQNPVIFQSPDGVLHLYHTSQPANRSESLATVWQLTSNDNGATWSSPQELFSRPGAYTRHPPLFLPNGTWLLPISYITGSGKRAASNYSAIELSGDRGKTWKECLIHDSLGLIQPTTIQVASHRFVTFFRDRAARWIYRSTSSDGCHWTKPERTVLPNNDASVQAYTLHDGHVVIVFDNSQVDHSGTKANGGLRKPLSIALSEDGGQSWKCVRDIEAGRPGYGMAEAKPKQPGREAYSYPSVVQTHDGRIHVAFTFRRETIKEVSFPEGWIRMRSTEGVYRRQSPCSRYPGLTSAPRIPHEGDLEPIADAGCAFIRQVTPGVASPQYAPRHRTEGRMNISGALAIIDRGAFFTSEVKRVVQPVSLIKW